MLKLVPKKRFLLRIHDLMMLEGEYPYRVDLYTRQLQCRHWSHHSFQPYIAFGLPNGVCFTCKDNDNNSRVPWMRNFRFYSIFAGIGSSEKGRGVPGVVMSSWFFSKGIISALVRVLFTVFLRQSSSGAFHIHTSASERPIRKRWGAYGVNRLPNNFTLELLRKMRQ